MPWQEITFFAYVNNKGSNQPSHSHSLIRVFCFFHLLPRYTLKLPAEEIRWAFDDNSKIIFCQIFIKTFVVVAY